MVVQRDAYDGVDEDLELGAVRNPVREGGVTRVYAFHEQHCAFFSLEVLAVVFPQAGYEVELRHAYLLSCKQAHKVVLHRLVVNGVEVVEVEGSVGEAWGVVAVYEVIVRRYGYGAETASQQLCAQALGDGGLTAGAWTGNQHEPEGSAAVAVLDFLSNLDYLFLLQGLGNLDELAGVALLDCVVYVANVVQVHYGVPLEVLAEDLEGLGLGLEDCEFLRGMTVRYPQQETVFIKREVPDLEIAGGGDKGVVIIVRSALQGVIADVWLAAGLQELHFIIIAECGEDADGLFVAYLNALERGVCRHYLPHPVDDAFDVLACHGRTFAELAEITFGDGSAHLYLAVREDVPAGFAQQEAQGPAVGAAPYVGAVVEEFHVAAVVGAVLEALGYVVDFGAENVVWTVEVELRKSFRQSDSLLEFQGGAGVLAIYLEHAHKNSKKMLTFAQISTNMSVVHVIDHPMIQHKLSIMRQKETGSKDFRQLLKEISILMGYEVTRDLPLTDIHIETPIGPMTASRVLGRKMAIVPILRAGLGMVDGLLDLVPVAKVGHIGLYRNETTHKPVVYYCKLPEDIQDRLVIVTDPMLATGGSSCDALQMLKERGVANARLMCLVAAPEGIAKVQAEHPDVDIYVAAIDERLNSDAYIVPGLGDAGDRIFGTK